MENKMESPLMGKLDAGAAAAALLPEFTRIVERKLDHWKRQTRNAALDDMDAWQYKIQRQPLVAGTAACAVGFAVGLLVPLFFRTGNNE